MNHGSQSSSEGAARSAWALLILLFLAACIPALGFSTWLIGIPILLVCFILSIVVLARGRAGSGIMILITTVLIAPLFLLFAPVISSIIVGKYLVDKGHLGKDKTSAAVAEVSKVLNQVPKVSQEMQQALVSRYPDLATKGSDLHTAFFTRIQDALASQPGVFANPNWPAILAGHAAEQVQGKAVRASDEEIISPKQAQNLLRSVIETVTASANNATSAGNRNRASGEATTAPPVQVASTPTAECRKFVCTLTEIMPGGGSLATGHFYDIAPTYTTEPEQLGEDRDKLTRVVEFFISGLGDGHIDEEKYTGWLVRAGAKTFMTEKGTYRTVAAYAVVDDPPARPIRAMPWADQPHRSVLDPLRRPKK